MSGCTERRGRRGRCTDVAAAEEAQSSGKRARGKSKGGGSRSTAPSSSRRRGGGGRGGRGGLSREEDMALIQQQRLGYARCREPKLPFEPVPQPPPPRLAADGNHFLNDGRHRRAAELLGAVLLARYAEEDHPLSGEETLGALSGFKVGDEARDDVMLHADEIPTEYTPGSTIHRRVDGDGEPFFHHVSSI